MQAVTEKKRNPLKYAPKTIHVFDDNEWYEEDYRRNGSKYISADAVRNAVEDFICNFHNSHEEEMPCQMSDIDVILFDAGVI